MKATYVEVQLYTSMANENEADMCRFTMST